MAKDSAGASNAPMAAWRRVIGRAVAAFALLLPMAAAVAAPRITEAWIPLPDGVRLAADLYADEAADLTQPHPVLLEYLPYRKTESRARNHALYAPFLRAGYVVARVDIRGTGNSDGTLPPHEYSEAELADGERVIAWLAAQPWSSGRVGMFGISWGGFNAIQMTLRHPPALKAILAIDATEELYAEDVHYIDGILHVDSWEMSQDLDNARPGAPEYRIDEAYFRERFDQPPWLLAAKREQRMGPYWSRASARGRYGEITTPMFLIGGWYDGYRSSIPRFLQQVKQAPVKALIGPWTHAWPHEGGPGPAIEWRPEAIRWYDHWLRGKDTGLFAEPPIAVFVRDAHGPGPSLDTVEGRWRWESAWPPSRVKPRTLHLAADHRLRTAPGPSAAHALRYAPAAGIEAGGPVLWWGDVAADQRPTDAQSLVYDTPPLAAPIEILGTPRVHLAASASARRANWFVRLSDVAPNGRVTLITGVGLNATQRESASAPRAVVPGQRMALDADLHATSWVFPKGHRIRVSIGNAQWPMLWPTPWPMRSTLFLGGRAGSTLTLPIVAQRDGPGPSFAPPEPAATLPGFEGIDDQAASASGFGEVSAIERDAKSGRTTVTLRNAGGMRYPWGSEHTEETIEHRVRNAAPETASVTGHHRIRVELPGRTLEWESETELVGEREHLRFHYVRRLYEDGKLVREKTWRETLPRDFQ